MHLSSCSLCLHMQVGLHFCEHGLFGLLGCALLENRKIRQAAPCHVAAEDLPYHYATCTALSLGCVALARNLVLTAERCLPSGNPLSCRPGARVAASWGWPPRCHARRCRTRTQPPRLRTPGQTGRRPRTGSRSAGGLLNVAACRSRGATSQSGRHTFQRVGPCRSCMRAPMASALHCCSDLVGRPGQAWAPRARCGV